MEVICMEVMHEKEIQSFCIHCGGKKDETKIEE
jgi:hypothetical protein